MNIGWIKKEREDKNMKESHGRGRESVREREEKGKGKEIAKEKCRQRWNEWGETHDEEKLMMINIYNRNWFSGLDDKKEKRERGMDDWSKEEFGLQERVSCK